MRCGVIDLIAWLILAAPGVLIVGGVVWFEGR